MKIYFKTNEKMKIKDIIKSVFSRKSFESTEAMQDWLRVNIFDEYSSRDLHKMSNTDYLHFYKGRCYVAISTIAKAVAWLDKQVTDGKWTPINDRIFDLITHDLLINIVSYMKLNGACYVRKNKVWNQILDLQVLRTDLVTPILNATRTKIDYYEYDLWQWHKTHFDPDEIMTFMNFNPLFPYPLNYKWMSDVEWIATAIDADYQASKYNRKFFYNNANVDGVLETDQNLSQEIVQQIQTKRDQKYRWTDNSQRIWILTGGLKYRSVKNNQKDMDFVEWRRFNRDEILWFFGVPKAMIGLGEWWEALNVRSFERIFAKRVVEPLAKQIAEKLNNDLFSDWVWFEFVNVIPSDLTETRQDRLANWITLNEFRASRNLPPVADGDKLRSAYILGAYGAWSEAWNAEQEVVDLDNDKSFLWSRINPELKNKIDWIIEKNVKENIRWTEEYNEKYWKQKMERNNKFNDRYFELIQKIFAKQEKEILKWYSERYKENQKSFSTKATKTFPLLNIAKRQMIYYNVLKDAQDDLVKTEAQNALIEVGLFDQNFELSKTIEKELKKNIYKFSGEIDNDTNKQLTKDFEKIIQDWLSFDDWRELILWTFKELTTTRADRIVRTETVRAWNYGSELWRKQSGVVEKKQRYTALDERVCEYCWPMNWKVIWLWENYFEKGDVLIGANGHEMKLDYSNTPYPPLHVNCRCVILPVIE